LKVIPSVMHSRILKFTVSGLEFRFIKSGQLILGTYNIHTSLNP